MLGPEARIPVQHLKAEQTGKTTFISPLEVIANPAARVSQANVLALEGLSVETAGYSPRALPTPSSIHAKRLLALPCLEMDGHPSPPTRP